VSTDEEVVIMEKVALRQRISNTAQRGFIVLTNKRLIFQPKLTLAGSAIFWGGIIIFLVGFVVFCLPFIALWFSEGFTLTVQFGLLLGTPFYGIGLLMMWWAYRKRKPKEIAMQLTDIVDVSETGEGGLATATLGGGRQGKFRIKLRDAKKMDPSMRGQVFETRDGGYEERFAMYKTGEFLDEVRIALRGKPMEAPSYLVATENVEVPKYSVPEKYPGTLVRLQKTYLTPKICCMCGEPAPEKTLAAGTSTLERHKQGEALAGPLTNLSTPLTHPFPICSDCFRVYKRAKTAGTFGGILGLIVGGAIFALLYFSGLLTPILLVIAVFFGSIITGLSDQATFLFFLSLFALSAAFFGGVGWLIARDLARDAIATRQVPQERKAFFKTIAADKGIRVRKSPGFVAFGFLSKEFATVFGQINGGTATAVEMSAEEKKKIGKNKS